MEFINRIAAMADTLTMPRTLSEWKDQCADLLADFISADDDMAPELATVAEVVASIGELAEKSGFA